MKLSQREFDRLRWNVEGQELVDENETPIHYGVEHAIFEQHKLERLIAAARKIHTPTVRIQRQQWLRQLKCARQDQLRFQKLRDDIRTGRPDFLKSLAERAQ